MISVNKLFSSTRVVAESPFGRPARGSFQHVRRDPPRIISFISKPAMLPGSQTGAQVGSDRRAGRIGPRAPSRHHLLTQRMPATALQRYGTQKLPRTKPGKRNFFSICFRSDRAARRALLSTSGCDSIFGSDPPRSRPPLKYASRNLQKNNWRGRLAA